jgi:HD domain
MNDVGTLSWLERTGGKLAWRDRLAFLAQGVRAKIEARRRINAGIKVRNIEVDEILPPDSAIAREAVALCEDVSEPFLFNHCLRAYFWARLLDDDPRPFDDEALFTAFMLHDMGITERYRLDEDAPQQCFTIPGAKLASELAAKHGWSDKRARIAAESIALHLNVVVDPRHGKEAQMLRIGSGGDVAGLGLHMLHAEQIDAVVARYPRLDMKRKVIPPLKIESQARPCCRIAYLRKTLGFDTLIRDAAMFRE